MRSARILVTGFEPNDNGHNASQVVVESLVSDAPAALESLGARLRYSILPGNTHILANALVALIEEHQPDFCLLVGQARGRSRITFERVAINLRDFMVADRAGNIESGSRILADAPVAYFSTIDASQLAQALDSAGIPASPSNHAGNHLCNQALFVTLHHAAMTRRCMQAIFIHIPLLPSQVSGRWADHPTMSLTMLRDAVVHTICHVMDTPIESSELS